MSTAEVINELLLIHFTEFFYRVECDQKAIGVKRISTSIWFNSKTKIADITKNDVETRAISWFAQWILWTLIISSLSRL